MPAKMFDPLRCLECDMQIGVSLGEDARLNLRFKSKHSRAHRVFASAIARDYRDVIVLQCRTGKSAKDLLVHGMLSIVNGRLALK